MPRPIAAPLVGRAAELEQLRQLLAQAAAGECGVALLGGDAGSGKTRLVQESVRLAAERGFITLVGACVPVGDNGLPYLPVLDVLRQVESQPGGRELLQETVQQRPALGRLVPHLLAVSAGETDEGLVRGQLFEALHRLLLDLAARSPLLVVLEDLHWADGATRDLLAFLARTLRTGRVAVLATYRTDDLHRRHPLRPLLADLGRLPQVQRLQVAALTRDELAALVEGLTGAPADARRVEVLHQRSGGNPFFAEELVHSDPTRRDLPADLADVLLDRVAQLPPAAAQVLAAVAVAAREVDEDLLARVVDLSEAEVERGVRDALESGLLRTATDGYAPRHALLQEAVYGDLLPRERGRWHARFARALAEDPGASPGELAHHLLGAHRRADALPASLAAAREAERLAAPGEALTHLERALELLDELGTGADRLDLLSRAADAAFGHGDPRRAAALARAAVQEADAVADVERRAQTRERLTYFLMDVDSGGSDDSGPAREAAELLQGRPETALTARVMATWARANLWLDVRRAADLLEQTAAIAERVGAGHLAADAMISRALLAERGIVDDDPSALFERALARVGTTSAGVGVRIRALRFVTAHRLEHGELTEALAAADEGVEAARSAGMSWSAYGLDLRLMRGWVLMALGRWDEVLDAATKAQYSQSAAAQVLAAQAVWVLVGRGDPGADQLAARLRAAGGDWFLRLQLDLAEMRWRWQQGRPEAALEVGRQIRAAMPDNDTGFNSEYLLLVGHEVAALALLAERARAAGDADETARRQNEAAALAAGATALPRGAGASTPYRQMLLARIEAEAARASGTESDADWAALQAAAERAGQMADVALARARRFALRLADGDRGEVTAELGRQAVAAATTIGAGWLADQVTGAAQRARFPLGVHARTAPGVELLTAREAQVLALLAAGRSNGAIAAELFISIKTASVHVSHILAKLGAASRTEAVALARSRGLL